MLVLTRWIGEEMLIGDIIRVKVVAATGNQVRLGITAPSSVGVLRQELVATCSEEAGLPMAEKNA